MLANYKRSWVTALRSGKFKQHTSYDGYAHHTNCTYCAVGVLYKIAGFRRNHEEDFGIGQERELRELTGLRCGQISKIIGMNDLFHQDFNQIADWIEQNVEVTNGSV